MRTALVLAAALALAPWSVPVDAQGQVQVEAELAPDPVSIEEVARLTIEVRTRSLAQPRFSPRFELDNLAVLGQPHRSETFRFVNGVSMHSSRLTWYLRPLRPGPAAARSIQIELDGDVYDLPDERIDVINQPPRRRPGAGRQPFPPRPRFYPDRDRLRDEPVPATEPRLFVRAEVSPQRPYVGQQVKYSLYLYTQADIASINAQQIPDFAGFWAEEMPRRTSDPEIVTHDDGQTYGRAVIFERLLTPRRAGRFEIGPAELDLVARVAERRVFGPSFVRPERVLRESNPVTVEVRPLPPPPPGFAGAVGALAIDARLAPAEIPVGEAATVTVTLEGSAHLPSLPPPSPPEAPGLEVFPPEEAGTVDYVGDRAHRRRTWTWTVTPEHAGRFELGPFEVPFYDPSIGGYRTAATAPLTLDVRAADTGSEAAAAATVPTADLHPIRSAAIPTDAGAGGRTRLLAALFALPLGLMLLLTWSRKRRAAAGGDGAAGRLHAVLDSLAAEDGGTETPRSAAHRTEEAWAAFLEERWGVARTVPATRWADNLAERRDLLPDGRRLTEPVLAELAGLADDLRYLRQAPQLSDTGALRRELAQRSRRLLERLS